MSFAKELANVSIKTAKKIQDEHIKKLREFENAKAAREDKLMKELTKKYHKNIKFALLRTALNTGKREQYINFDYEDFKANFPELGKPCDVCNRWLSEMTNPKSKYLPYKIKIKDNNKNNLVPENELYLHEDMLENDPYSIMEITDEKDHFEGLKFNIWNNFVFTVHFTW